MLISSDPRDSASPPDSGRANGHRCACAQNSASSQIKALERHNATRNPHDTTGAASGHAWLGYAGGSWRSSEPFEIGNPEPGRILDRQSFAREFGKRGSCYGRNDANHKRHIPTRLLDMFGKRTRVVIYGMGVDRAVGMSVCN